MLRNRDVFLNEFFGADGSSQSRIAEPTPTTSPAPTSPVAPALPEVIPTVPSLADTPPVIPRPKRPYPDSQPIIYPVVYPRYNPLLIIDEPVYVIPDENDVVMNPTISTGGGGGFGNGAMVEEGTDKGGEEIKMAKPDNKKKILWLVLIALVLYFGYRYWKKRK